MSDPTERLQTLFLQELHRAIAACRQNGANPADLSTNLKHRLHRLQRESCLHQAESVPRAHQG